MQFSYLIYKLLHQSKKKVQSIMNLLYFAINSNKLPKQLNQYITQSSNRRDFIIIFFLL